MSDISGVEVRCVVCGKHKAPVGRSVAAVTWDGYCHDDSVFKEGRCSGYTLDPQMGWLFQGELWSESFGNFPLPNPSECYRIVEK